MLETPAGQFTIAVALSMLILDAVKFVIRKRKEDQLYSFPTKFYAVVMPILAFSVQPLLSVLGFGEYSLPTDWVLWLQELARVGLGVLAQVFLYENTLSPWKASIKAKEAG